MYGPARLLLDDDRAVSDATTNHNVADLDLHDIAAAQLAIDRKIEHGPITQPAFPVEPEPHSPDLLRLERPLGTELPTGVPWLPAFHARIEF